MTFNSNSTNNSRDDTPFPTPSVENKVFDFLPKKVDKIVVPHNQASSTSNNHPSLVRPPQFDGGCLNETKTQKANLSEIDKESYFSKSSNESSIEKDGLSWSGQYPWRVPKFTGNNKTNGSNIPNGHVIVHNDPHNGRTMEMNRASQAIANSNDSTITSDQRKQHEVLQKDISETATSCSEISISEPLSIYCNDTNIPWDIEGTETIVNNLPKPKFDNTAPVSPNTSVSSESSTANQIQLLREENQRLRGALNEVSIWIYF